MPPTRVLIFECDAAGHRLHYVRMCVQAIADLGVEIVFATDASVPETEEFRTHMAPVLGRIRVDASLATIGANSRIRSASMRVSALYGAIERHTPDHVYVPYADGFAQISGAARLLGRRGLRKPTECEGILMRGRFAYPHSSWGDGLFARAWLAATSLSPIDILHFLDPIPYERVMEGPGPLAARARLIPEPVERPLITDRHAARRLLHLPLEGRIVCCPGWLDERKGVNRLVRAFAGVVRELRPDDRLLLVGRMDQSVHAALAEVRELVQEGRIIVHEGVVSDEHLHQAIAAAHVVAATYPRHIGSSGIVVRAAAFERMVLASDFGWVGMVTNRFGLGVTCDCRDDSAIARALPAALESAESFRMSEAAKRFAQFHTQANFAAHLARRLRQRLGCSTPEEIQTWDWVLQGNAPGDISCVR